MTIAVIARLKAAEGKEAEFEKTMLELAATVREKESGNQLYTLCKDESGDYVMLELYDDAAALKAHGESEHFKAAGARFADLLAGRPKIQRMEVIG